MENPAGKTPEYRTFLEQLFGNKSDDLNILIYLLPLKKARFFKTVEGACDFIENINEKPQNIFFGCGLVRPGIESGRGKKEDIAGIGGFWADIDFQSGDKPGFPTDLAAVKELIYGHGMDPTHLIFTGNGVHAWWAFKEVWEFSSRNEAMQAEKLNNRLQETILKRARQKGWAIDKTHDTTRILRPPGTFNRKDPENPIPTKILEEGPQIPYSDPTDLEEFLISEDELKASEKPHKNEQIRIEHNLKLDPEANPPSDRMQDLLDIEPDFKASWNAQRPDFKKQSASEYALSLANYAAQANWSDQEIADLIVAFYRRHGQNSIFEKKPDIRKALRSDYLSRTIAMARSATDEQSIEDYYKNICPSLNTEYEQKLDPDGAKAKKNVCLILGLEIEYVEQFKTLKDSKYVIKANHYDSTSKCTKNSEISFESTAHFNDKTRFQNRIFEITTVYRNIKRRHWEEVIKPNWGKFMRVEEVGPQEIASRLKEWFQEYLNKDQNRTVNDATIDKMPFIHKDHWYVHPDHLNSWAITNGFEKYNISQTVMELEKAKCEKPEKLNAINPNNRKKTTVRGFYKIPHSLVSPPTPQPPLRLISNKTEASENTIEPKEKDNNDTHNVERSYGG